MSVPNDLTEAEIAYVASEVLARLGRKAFLGNLRAETAFREQAEYIESDDRFITLRGSRRMGKTSGHARKLLRRHCRPPFTHQYFIAPTLKRAKEIVWGELRQLNKLHGLGGVPNETTGTMRFPLLPNAPEIRLGGVNSKDDIDKIRGDIQAPKTVIADEAQSMRPSTLKNLINDAAEPALADYGGQLVISGTPGAVCAGYWYDIDVGNESKGWKHFHWTLKQNLFLQRKRGLTGEQILAEVLARRSIDETDPTYRREWLGLWVDDPDALVYKYSEARNGYSEIPHDLSAFVEAFDIGFEDSDAIALLGWPEFLRTVYVVEQVLNAHEDVTDLGGRLREIYNKRKPRKLVGDLGALGKKIAEEFIRRWKLPVVAVDKGPGSVLSSIKLVNDALVTGALMLEKNSPAAEEALVVQWDADKRAKGELTVSKDTHSDIWDAIRYGYQECYHYVEPARPDEIDEVEVARRERKREATERREAQRDPMGDGGELFPEVDDDTALY